MYYPCPQTFYFATNSTQYLPAFRLGYLQTCIFSINSTQEIKLTINRVNKTSNFGIKVYETKSFPDPYEKDLEGQLAKIERYSPFNSFPLIVTSRTESVSVLISSFDLNNSIIPYEIEFIAVKHECKCGDTYLKADINEWKILYSPEHPKSYCASMNCLWHIEAPEGHHILFNIAEFNTEENQDFALWKDYCT
uniref:CUB domain-containing protein n=1 Tax=Meloidogyne floridensis TaxID=298350 RepID=A0A915NGN3_9BILA